MKFAIILAATLAASAASAAPSGEAVFKQRCAVCHSIAPAPGKMGPPLAGVAGRKAGTLPGYAYSAAMKGSKLVWDAAALDTYLKAPAKSVPGTKMLVGAPDAEQRAALVQYLGTLKN
ncbi:c-type cytochrome [Phenylobacterium sp.]|uniref:c-type cytochrome n=1 Tax=Phenylobacterium sp. TaxID=1871053 RepID=UPI00289FBE5A|nr:c-type cytochrome [Phenylobacterium sp.]